MKIPCSSRWSKTNPQCEGYGAVWLSLLLILLQVTRVFAAGDADAGAFCADVAIPLERHHDDGAKDKITVGEVMPVANCVHEAQVLRFSQRLTGEMAPASISVMDCVEALQVSPTDLQYLRRHMTVVANVCMKKRPSDDPAAVDSAATALYEALRIRLETALMASTGEALAPNNAGLQLSPVYPFPGGQRSPMFEFGGANMSWSKEESLEDRHRFEITATMDLRNTGHVPLTVFHVVFSRVDSAQGLVVLRPASPVLLGPQSTVVANFSSTSAVTIAFAKGEDEEEEEDNGATVSPLFLMHISHSAFRNHQFESRIHDGQFDLSGEHRRPSKTLAKRSGKLRKPITFASTSHNADPSSLFRSWRVVSMSAVCAVGMFATLFVLRKWQRVLDLCPRANLLLRRRIKHKVSSLSKVTTGSGNSSRSTSFSSNQDVEMLEDIEADEKDALMIMASNDKAHGKDHLNTSAQRTPTDATMPAITMHWTRPSQSNSTLSIRKNLDLDQNVELQPKEYESMWEEFVECHSATFTATTRPDSSNLIKQMEYSGIVCMASGTVKAVDKYLFYAKQTGIETHFLVELSFQLETKQLKLSIRMKKDNSTSHLLPEFSRLVETITQRML